VHANFRFEMYNEILSAVVRIIKKNNDNGDSKTVVLELTRFLSFFASMHITIANIFDFRSPTTRFSCLFFNFFFLGLDLLYFTIIWKDEFTLRICSSSTHRFVLYCLS